MELFSYLLKVSACTVLFFAFYLLVLRKLTFFKINRFYLLFSLLLSFIIPALQFTIEREIVAPIQTVANPFVNDSQNIDQNVFEAPITVSSIQVKGTGSFNWLNLLPIIYSAIVFGLLVIALMRVLQLLKHINVSIKTINGLKLVPKRNGFTNCSFFNYVFIDENSLTEAELAVLLAHEEVHVKQYHSVDKLLMIIAKAFLWFNPIVYLYDKALEQVHEYEADDLTSKNIGTESYASLLLKLAVHKSSNPLLHNFVKSPIKERIRMLFNSKSTHMKKLIYLLVLPIGLGLIWGFTVKVTHRVKPLAQQEAPQLQDTLVGKTVKGKVISFEKIKMMEVLNLQVGNTILPIDCYHFKNKVKVGDEITVTIGGNSFPPPPVVSKTDLKGNKIANIEKTAYMVSKVVGANWQYTYEKPSYAFGYETNRARYAWSIIKLIDKNANGTINRIVLNDREFTINLNVAAQQFKNNDFKKGDSIVVKFIGEKLTGTKTYTTDKMIALYSWPKKHELINKALYPKFYDENGKQKVNNKQGQPKIGQNKAYPSPVLLSSSSAIVDQKNKTTYLKDAKIQLFNGTLEAKEVQMNQKQELVTAKEAKFKTQMGKMLESELMTFNNKSGAFTATYPAEKAKPNSIVFDLISKRNFGPLDSVKIFNPMGGETIMLRGNVKMNIDNYKINAKVITANRNSNILKVYLGSVKNGDEPAFLAKVIDFDVVTKQIKVGEMPY